MNRHEHLRSSAAAVLAGVAAAPFDAVAASTTPLSSASAADKVLTPVRTRAHPDGRPCYSWYRGTFYGQRSGLRTVPLVHIEGSSTARVGRENEGIWLYWMREAGWFFDHASGKILEDLHNPLNHKVMRPHHYNSQQQLRFGKDGVVSPATTVLPAGLEWQGTFSEPVIAGLDVWSSEESLVRIAPGDDRPPRCGDEIAQGGRTRREQRP